jgi:hypothetical protein
VRVLLLLLLLPLAWPFVPFCTCAAALAADFAAVVSSVPSGAALCCRGACLWCSSCCELQDRVDQSAKSIANVSTTISAAAAAAIGVETPSVKQDSELEMLVSSD